MIEVQHLTRVFRTYKKQPGFLGGVRGLFHREFEETRAADDISFAIHEGEFVGFLGPNGAGKTTTLKMLSGLIYPTSGTARRRRLRPDQARKRLPPAFRARAGPEEPAGGGTCPRSNHFTCCGRSTRCRRPSSNRRSTSSSPCSGGKKLNVMVRELSLGERMKMELIAALLHRPRVLFLDEPTIGLDVVSRKTSASSSATTTASTGSTILLTSHYMADIAELCERVIVIHKGQEDLRRRPGSTRERRRRQEQDR
jgi:ABC-2 type transport system ATP-binding protein